MSQEAESPNSSAQVILSARHIDRSFPGVVANSNIDLELYGNEILAILGENGAGKTTLMNILYGLYQPDSGEILLRGQPIQLHSPLDAIGLGIGMIHQHFMLIPTLTVLQNIILGTRSSFSGAINTSAALAKINEIQENYGLKVNPDAFVWTLSVGEQHRVEIIKTLYRGARILLLDEPTAVLTPQEIDGFFEMVRLLVVGNCSVILITHKIEEVLDISDRVVVMRQGKKVFEGNTRDCTAQSLSNKMIGDQDISLLQKQDRYMGSIVLDIKDLRLLGDRGNVAVKNVSLELRTGEIVGVAGVDGNGQKELAEAISGLRDVRSGYIRIGGKSISPRVAKRRIAYIPDDRQQTGLAMSSSIEDNAIVHVHDRGPISKNGILQMDAMEKYTKEVIGKYDIKVTSIHERASNLSGGNQQKLVVGRELSRDPDIIVACYPTRGLDIAATSYVRNKILAARDNGKAVLLVSNDLNEIFSLSDRIAVMFSGNLSEPVLSKETTIEAIGSMMTGIGVIDNESSVESA